MRRHTLLILNATLAKAGPFAGSDIACIIGKKREHTIRNKFTRKFKETGLAIVDSVHHMHAHDGVVGNGIETIAMLQLCRVNSNKIFH